MIKDREWARSESPGKEMLKAKRLLGKTFHPVHTSAYLTYFAAVAVEGHGFYAMAAGGMFFLNVLGLLLGEDD